MEDPWRRLRLGLLILAGVLVAGTAGYVILGFSLLDAVYQTVTTVTTVGFREVQPLSDLGQVFTIVLILTGVGTALYNLSLVIQAVIEGELAELLGRRKMERQIGRMGNHVIVCGWGRVGRAIAHYVARAGEEVVVVDRDPERAADDRAPASSRATPPTTPSSSRPASTGPGSWFRPDHRRRQPLRHPFGPFAAPRPLHRGPGPGRRAPTPSSSGPAPTGWSTRRASAASAWPPSCSSPTWPSSSTSSCTTAPSNSAWRSCPSPESSPLAGAPSATPTSATRPAP